jgi:hypothetical protein
MKHLLLVGVFFIFSVALYAQDQGVVTLNGYGGYNFEDKIGFDNAHAYVDNGYQWGGGLEIFMALNKSLELKYLRSDTHFPLYIDTQNGQYNEGKDAGSLNYILVGGNNYFPKGQDARVAPFAGVDLGVCIMEGEGDSATKFAWDAKVGIKIQSSSTVALKLHAYMQSVISTFGTDYWNTNTGTYAVPDYASIFQFGVGAAICFDFKKK